MIGVGGQAAADPDQCRGRRFLADDDRPRRTNGAAVFLYWQQDLQLAGSPRAHLVVVAAFASNGGPLWKVEFST